jgi:hypothetical protein
VLESVVDASAQRCAGDTCNDEHGQIAQEKVERIVADDTLAEIEHIRERGKKLVYVLK